MKNIKYTDHAIKRCQSRGIPFPVVEFIVRNGKRINTHGDKKYFVTKKQMNSFKYEYKEIMRLHDKIIRNTAVICNGNSIITAMKIIKRIK